MASQPSSAAASFINADHPSLVRHWKQTSTPCQNESKLRSSVRNMPRGK